ncbi:hypothetical protein [Kocuria sp.]|uniref:hypothetical protein n=1 Tax=Kocuria sp. TaxID=1871328 RepID=UPI0026E0E74C|nr:hypothetical protein [Kocuria sp.]MDO5617644.1 hypothetical protein [Kocuria sp.]
MTGAALTTSSDSHTAQPASAHTRRRDGVARVVAAVLSPSILASAVLVVAGSVDSGVWGFWWAAGTAVLLLGVPMAVLIYLSHRGVVDSRYVRNRAHRFPVYGGVCVLIVAVLVAQLTYGSALGIPLSVTLTAMFLLLGVVTLMVITLVWKVSAHTAMAATFAVAVPVLLGGWLVFFTWVIPVAVAWSRLRTADHTYWQTVVGIWIGVLIGGFYGLMWSWWI